MKASIQSIVVARNGEDDIVACLDSLIRGGIPENHITVVDNDSDDQTCAVINEKFDQLHCLRLSENKGFGEGNNIGLKSIWDTDFDYVLLINQDARLKEQTLDRLLQAYEVNPEYGIISPVHLFDENRLDVNFSRYIQHIDKRFFRDIFLDLPLEKVYRVPFVNAAIWLVSAECVRKVGGFDPLFHHFGQDNDYVQRARYHGFQTGICPSSFAYHKRAQENRSWSSYKEYLFSKDLMDLKTLDQPFNRLLFKWMTTYIKRCLAHLIQCRISDVVDSTRVFVQILQQIPAIRRHRRWNREHEASFID